MDVNDPAYAERLLTRQNQSWKKLLRVQWPYRMFLRSLHLGLTLDVGCGVGRNLTALGPSGVGVDTNETAVYLARKQGLEAFTVKDYPNSRWAIHDTFDSLLFAHVLEHMTQPEALATLRVWLPFLRPNGTVVLITPQEKGFRSDATHREFMDFARLAALLETAGLVVTRKCSFPFPRFAGHFFAYNEFVVLGRKRSP